MPPRDEEDDASTLAKYLRYSHVGVQFFLSVALFTAGGIWLDWRLGTGVLFTLAGLALGFTGGVYALYREFFPGKGSAEKGSGTGHSNQTSSPKKTD